MGERKQHAEVLKPCPFCAHAPTLRKTVETYEADAKHPAGEFDAEYSVSCDNCGASQSAEYRDDAIAAWNARPTATKDGAVAALMLAKAHLQHQSAWIAKHAPGYSFEALGEDMAEIDAALANQGQSQ